MKIYNRTRIAYITGRLITGKRIASLYDCSDYSQIEVASLPDADCLTEFDCKYKDYAGGSSGKYTYWFDYKKGHAIDLSINGGTFIGRITGSTAYFMGTVRGDMIHIYDHEDSLLLNYRITGCTPDEQSGNSCRSCWMIDQEGAAGAVV